MLRINELRLPIDHSAEELEKKIAKLLRTREEYSYKIFRRSLDARKKPDLYFSYTIDVYSDKEDRILKNSDKHVTKTEEVIYEFPFKNVCIDDSLRPVVVGLGPAGLFAALYLARAGFRPIVLERGSSIDERCKIVDAFWNGAKLDPDTNVQFGEGGAGAFSDGKLNTLVKDKFGRNRAVLRDLVKYNAPEQIEYDYKPHIGTDLLRDVVKNISSDIRELGGEIFYNTGVKKFIKEGDILKKVVCSNGMEFNTKVLILAIGHSARDTFEELKEFGLYMEPKPFAVGLRVEHAAELINKSQYGKERIDILGNAIYKVTHKCKNGRGVYSFCMCPGGYVVNASSEEAHLAINGMSYFDRDAANSNSAVIVTINPEDYGDGIDPLSGVAFQRELEKRAYEIGNGAIPVEFLKEFKANRILFENEMPPACIKGAYNHANVREILEDDIANDFLEGMEAFGKMIEGFDDNRTIVSGIESRTSSPLRMLRDESGSSNIINLFPAGEGAGYAGGITSAAMDGILSAERVATYIMNMRKDIRNEKLKMRKSMSKEITERKSELIHKKLLDMDIVKKADNILLYADYNSEVKTDALISYFLEEGRNVFLPKIDGENMCFLKMEKADDTVPGFKGIREPSVSEKTVYYGEEWSYGAVAVVPGSVFDTTGSRYGYGRGFYDRFLSANPELVKIALSFECQIYENKLPVLGTDIKMDYIVTEDRVLKMPRV